MLCPRCRDENPADALFCQECGARIETACPSCGTGDRPSAKYCKKGGAALNAAAGPATPVGQSPSPAAYTPKHLAEKILTSKAALADRDPEEARKILDPVLERMMEAVHRYEGTVNQVMGDGIMALFGAPLAYDDRREGVLRGPADARDGQEVR